MKRSLLVGLVLLAVLAVCTVPVATSQGALMRQPRLTQAEVDAYHRGVRDAAEAIARWMPTAGPRELLVAVGALAEAGDTFPVWFDGRIEPTGSGRVAFWLSQRLREQMGG